MVENINITELESYIRLCDRKKEILYRKLSTTSADTKLRGEYKKLFDAAELLEKEFNKRLDKLLDDAEKV